MPFVLGTIEKLSVGESVSDHKSKSKYDQIKSENTNSKVTKCHLFQEQSETFRTGSLCLATTQETLSGDLQHADEEDDNSADPDADDTDGFAGSHHYC